tara:strand:- start:4900 stop:5133 length:234 start_codon:yes stop_codon:yes gene_type:complete
MKYVVRKGYSYVDVKGRNQIFNAGSVFEGDVDTSQKWKLGRIDQAPEVKVETKVIETKEVPASVDTYDEMDEGEETE